MSTPLTATLTLGLLLAAGPVFAAEADADPALNLAGFSGGKPGTDDSQGDRHDDGVRNDDRGGSAGAAEPSRNYRIIRADATPAESAAPTPETRHWTGDIRRFHQRDYLTWNRGRWFHGEHNGDDGWWWVVGSSWYQYSTPTYPFPDPYVPGDMAPPPTNVANADAPIPDTDTPPSAPSYWYYCDKPQGYYPYVVDCNNDWQLVVPTPLH